LVDKFYREYMRSKKWANKRQAVFAKYGKRCYACGKAPKVLHVHHLSYEHFGNEYLSELRPLCVPCHREITRLEKRAGRRKDRLLIFNIYVARKRAIRPKTRKK
jgi:5-methylcytosine-specific restriction endonuclease McrA